MRKKDYHYPGVLHVKELRKHFIKAHHHEENIVGDRAVQCVIAYGIIIILLGILFVVEKCT